MRHFDYSFLQTGMLPANFVSLANAVSEMKVYAVERKNSYPAIFEILEGLAKVQSVKSSNEIEGIVTSDDRIRAIVNQNSAPLNHDEMEIAGYRDALDAIHQGYEQLDARESDILGLHATMLSYTPEGGGRYKTVDNYIVERDPQGRQAVRFNPTSAQETPEAIEQLLIAFSVARSEAGICDLLLIPCFVLDFLCIHPFSDGNGRLSRLLSLLLLYKSGFDVGQYISFEEQINQFKGLYYEALRQSSEGWHTNENSYFPFIENFLQMLLMCYKELDKRFAVIQDPKTTKTQRIRSVVLNSLLPISKREIAELLPDVSPTTIEAVLGAMVKEGAVEIVGKARSAKYSKKQRA